MIVELKNGVQGRRSEARQLMGEWLGIVDEAIGALRGEGN